MNDLLDQIVTIKALLSDLEMSIMQHKSNHLNEQQRGQCIECNHISTSKPNYCDRFNAYPPPDIIYGRTKCEGFDDDIPF
jgi:hypothetical protein